ncbi:MAG: alginate lyase family protein [Ignavibacterium sp.]
MKLQNIFSNIDVSLIGTKLFQREIEKAFYSKKSINLPPYQKVNSNNLLEFKQKFPFNFYDSFDEFEELSSFIKSKYQIDTIIASANKILDNKYNFFDLGEISLGEKINWQYDYHSDFEFRRDFYWKIDLLSLPKNVDPSFCWELSRFHQLIDLGLAYFISKDEKYTDKFLELFYSFNENNPIGVGINWKDPLEVSIRAINLLFAIIFFLPSIKINEKVINDILIFLIQHSIFLENNLNHNLKSNFRYIVVLTTMMLIGYILINSKYGERIFSYAKMNLELEIQKQIYSDGVFSGQSLPVQFLVLQSLTIAKIICDKYKIKLSDEYNLRLLNMFKVLAHSSYGNLFLRDYNSIPNIGDTITSPILVFNQNQYKINPKEFIAVGAYIFADNELSLFNEEMPIDLLIYFGKWVSTLWHSHPYGTGKVLNKNVLTYSNNKNENSIGFNEGMFYILKRNDLNFFIRAGEIGYKGKGAPGHNDTFTFEMFYKNQLFFVDSGTYSFYADRELRNKLRTAECHNTFYVDEMKLAELIGLFDIKEDITKPKILEWTTNDEEDILSVQHYAYIRLTDPVICRRTFHFQKDKNKIKIKDEFFGGRKHLITSNLHLHPDVKIMGINPFGKGKTESEYLLQKGQAQLSLVLYSPSDYFEIEILDSLYSEQYFHLIQSKKININLQEQLSTFYVIEINLL